jgi:hypothetical protein
MLGRDKKTLESEIEQIRHKQALTQKIDRDSRFIGGAGSDEHGILHLGGPTKGEREGERAPAAKTQEVRDFYYKEGNHNSGGAMDSRSHYSNFVKDMTQSSQDKNEDDGSGDRFIKMNKVEMLMKNNNNTVTVDTNEKQELSVPAKRHSADLLGANTNVSSRQQNFLRGRQHAGTNENEDPRDHYNNHILRSLERIA